MPTLGIGGRLHINHHRVLGNNGFLTAPTRLVQICPYVQINEYPFQFSGGMRARATIAMGLVCNPRVLIADEPVSALDVSVQAQTLNLLNSLQNSLGLTYLFISHDLSVARYVCDTIAVMYLGKLVEQTEVDELFTTPKHPYTSALIAPVPAPNPRTKWKTQAVRGEVSSGGDGIRGCDFAPRCPYEVDGCARRVRSFVSWNPLELSTELLVIALMS